MFWRNKNSSGAFAWERAPRALRKAEGRPLWWCQHLQRAPPAQLQLPQFVGISGASLSIQKWFSRWVLGFCRALLPPIRRDGAAPFPGVVARVPQVGEQRCGGSTDVGAVTHALVGKGGGTHGERGGGWLCTVPQRCTVRRTAGAETASPGACHQLMKMDLELLGDGLEKDGKEPSEMEKRTHSP